MIKSAVAILFILPITVQILYYVQEFIQNHTTVDPTVFENLEWPDAHSEKMGRESARRGFTKSDIDTREYIIDFRQTAPDQYKSIVGNSQFQEEIMAYEQLMRQASIRRKSQAVKTQDNIFYLRTLKKYTFIK